MYRQTRAVFYLQHNKAAVLNLQTQQLFFFSTIAVFISRQTKAVLLFVLQIKLVLIYPQTETQFYL